MATSKLQRATSQRLFKKYGKYGLVENTRPIWLISSKGERLELDFYIEKLRVAVEVQGMQHFQYTQPFHASEADFKEQLRRDREKFTICEKAGISLLYVCSHVEIAETVYTIDEMISEIIKPDDGYWHGWGKRKVKLKPVIFKHPKPKRKEKPKVQKPILTEEQQKAKKDHRTKKRREQKKRRRARAYKVHQVNDRLWISWGGSGLHVIERQEKRLVCDCRGHERTNGHCIHNIAIELYMADDPKVTYIESIENI